MVLWVVFVAIAIGGVLWGLYAADQAKERKRARAREALEDYRDTRKDVLGR